MHSLAREEDGYPARLGALSPPPERVWVEGDLPPPGVPTVAIVGTRRPDAVGLDIAAELAGELVRAGVTIVSGGAFGIDAAAHRSALAAGGRTVAVLASGIDRPTPARHRPLFDAIRRAGALLTAYPPGTPAYAGQFLERNALIAALGDATVVVEAPIPSGALSTAAWARRLGRPLFAVPGSPRSVPSRGCLLLLRRGALMCEDARDVLSAIGIEAARPVFAALPLDLDAGTRRLLDALGPEPLHLDVIAAAVGELPQRLASRLLILQFRGAVVDCGDGRYARLK